MIPTTINLSCVNCGANLSITDDVERFACSYCGHQLLVNRSGGIVALKDITETLKSVQAGTDKTAAELAMKRLEKEIITEQQRLTFITATCREDSNSAFGIIGAGVVGATICAITLTITIGLSKSSYSNFAVIVCMVGFAVAAVTATTLLVLFLIRATKTTNEKIDKETKPTIERIESLKVQWQKNRQIVDM